MGLGIIDVDISKYVLPIGFINIGFNYEDCVPKESNYKCFVSRYRCFENLNRKSILPKWA